MTRHDYNNDPEGGEDCSDECPRCLKITEVERRFENGWTEIIEHVVDLEERLIALITEPEPDVIVVDRGRWERLTRELERYRDEAQITALREEPEKKSMTTHRVINEQIEFPESTTGRKLKCLGCGSEGYEPIMHNPLPPPCTGPYEVLEEAPLVTPDLLWHEEDPRTVIKSWTGVTILVRTDEDRLYLGEHVYVDKLLMLRGVWDPIHVWDKNPWPEGWCWVLLEKED